MLRRVVALITLMMEVVSTSETSVSFYDDTAQHTRRHSSSRMRYLPPVPSYTLATAAAQQRQIYPFTEG
jgi:hypothetical protein